MRNNEYLKIKEKNLKIIALIQWSKKTNANVENKVIKEISLVNNYCKEQIGK